MLTLICGIPNAGKTTYSQRYNNVIHEDDIQKIDKICEMVSKENDVCAEGVFINSWRRQKVASAYKGERKICIWLDTPLEECISREDRSRSTVLVRNCNSMFEPPTFDEGWDEIIIIRGNNEQRINRQTED